MPQKKPFITLAQAKQIAADIPTPFHIYDEKGIRENARRVIAAFSWNKGFKEYFAVKATPNPYLLKILQEEGCGVDCSSYTELLMSEACGFKGSPSAACSIRASARAGHEESLRPRRVHQSG